MVDDFATLYYCKVSKNTMIEYMDIYDTFVKLLHDRNIRYTELVKDRKKLNKEPIRLYYISSISNPTIFHWRITVNILSLKSDFLVTIGLSPEAIDKNLIANKKQVEDLAIKDIESIRKNLGDAISLINRKFALIFNAFSYSKENFVNIGDWTVNLNEESSIKYSNYMENTKEIIYEMKKKKFMYRLINLSTQDSNKKSKLLQEQFSKFGSVLQPVLDASYASTITTINQSPNIMNIILFESDQDYFDSKSFFLERRLPFQHIRDLDKIFNNVPSINILLLEIIKKMDEQSLYLRPDIFRIEPVSGFIYLDDTVNKNYLTGDINKFLNISYVFTDSKDYTSERVFSYSDRIIPFYSTKGFIKIENTESLARKIKEDVGIESNNTKTYDIIVTKMMRAYNVKQMVSSLLDIGINVNKVIFVSNNTSRFADNFSNKGTHKIWDHPFKILADNIAVVKLATKPFLLPQMFSTFIRVVYPIDAKISSEDVKKVVWLTKKRLYRIYSLPYMTMLEPVKIRKDNTDFLANSTIGGYLLRQLI